jgi:hypothetical protein
VSGLAERRSVPLAPLVPVGIDGGLIGVVGLDLVLSWIGQPIGWLRQFVRILTVGTVAANAAAGWPDAVAAGLHIAAPLMLLAMVEAGRTVLLRRIGGPAGRPRDPIPVARWLLAPWPTWLMWRRMVLWQISSFRTAVEAEQERRHAVVLLRARYGRRWKRHAPAELVWVLQSGVSTRNAVARARALPWWRKRTADISRLTPSVRHRERKCPQAPGPPRTDMFAGRNGGHVRTARKPLPVTAVKGRGFARPPPQGRAAAIRLPGPPSCWPTSRT